ncbi:MAG: DUF3857 domain-containing protein [Candidatus Aminicenantes bacterium]|nr:DUF3857 domain-containing protein [Candidatus Aminicenantes bacterium]
MIFLALVPPISAQTIWPPISDEEKALKDCPQQPGAPAICLYRELTTEHEKGTTTVFKRLKILTDAGRDRANVEIPFLKGRHLVTAIEARVTPAKGEPREIKCQVFEKTALRAGKVRVAVKSFALPDVDTGSIIDYRFRIEPDPDRSSGGDYGAVLAEMLSLQGKPEEGGIAKAQELLSFPAMSWEIQDELFARKAKFVYISHPQIGILFGGECRMAWVAHGLGNASPSFQGGRVELEMDNIPAFEAEEFMTPAEAERMSVDIFYLNRKITDDNEYWKRESQDWQKGAEGFIGDPRKLAATAQGLVAGVTDPSKKLEKIYERAQTVRNLSYEKALTRKQRKEQNIKDNRKASEVLERNYGVRSDVTRTFVALARAAGFTADIARVSTRDDKLFRIKLLSFYNQLDSEVAAVKLGEKTLLFDPATPFCPFGLIHWSRSNTAAVRFSLTPPAFFTTSVYPPDLALTQRELALQLDAQGTLSGTIRVTYTGHEALVRRLEYLHSDEAARKKGLEEELSGILPKGAAVTLKQLDNIDNNSPYVAVLFDVALPGIATTAGDRMLLPVSPLLGAEQYPFRHAERKYPIYFPYPFREFNDVIVTIPEGLTVENCPVPSKSQREFSSYSLVCANESPRKLHIQRDLIIQKSYFPVGQYAALKAFYDAVRSSDEEQVVLVRAKR